MSSTSFTIVISQIRVALAENPKMMVIYMPFFVGAAELAWHSLYMKRVKDLLLLFFFIENELCPGSRLID